MISSRWCLLLVCVCYSLIVGFGDENIQRGSGQFRLKDVKKVVEMLRQKSLAADIEKDCAGCERQSNVVPSKKQTALKSQSNFSSVKQQPTKNTRSRQLKSDRTVNNKKPQMPSLLLDASTGGMNHLNRSCSHAMNRNVTTLLNKGQLLYGTSGISVTELRFPVQRVLLSSKHTFSAFIHTPPPNLKGSHESHWRSTYAGSTFLYQIYEVKAKDWRHVLGSLKQKKNSYFEKHSEGTLGLDPESERKEVLKTFSKLIDRPIAERNVSYNKIHMTSESAHALDISVLLGKWKKAALRRRIIREDMAKLILVVIEDKQPKFPTQLTRSWCDTSSKKECFQLSMVRLILISMELSKRNELHHENASVRRRRAATKKESTRKTNKNVTKLDKTNTQQDGDHSANGKVTQVSNLEFSQRRLARSIQSSICQRYPLWVNFEDLGWSEWVIAPRAIQAYRCSGTCPYPLSGRMNGTNHAMLMSMMHSVNPETSPMPCCVPTRFSSSSILYLDKSENVVLQKYDDMVIESCGCR